MLRVAVICCVTAANMTLYGMADDSFDVYVDGVTVISSCRLSTYVCNATVNVANSLIAVNLINFHGAAFFIMSLGYGGCVTTMPWRCTTTLYAKWTDLDDSAWPLAVAAPGTNGGLSYFNPSTISSTCPGINIADKFNLNNTYCRLWLTSCLPKKNSFLSRICYIYRITPNRSPLSIRSIPPIVAPGMTQFKTIQASL
jgi:hypothetical protein